MDIPEASWPELVGAADFEFMRKNGATLMPRAALSWDKGHERFLNKGENGLWKDFLTDADLARYDALVERRLSPALAAWLERGRLVAGDPRALPD